jgi:hypothetical protein
MFVLLLGKKNSLLFLVLLEFWLKCICVCYRFAKNAVIIAEGVEATRIFQVALFVRSSLFIVCSLLIVCVCVFFLSAFFARCLFRTDWTRSVSCREGRPATRLDDVGRGACVNYFPAVRLLLYCLCGFLVVWRRYSARFRFSRAARRRRP